MKTIVVTETEYFKAKPVFDACPPGFVCVPASAAEDLLADAIEESRASHAIVGSEDYAERIYRVLPVGGVLARFGVGHDGIDKRKATAAGILCTNTPGTLDQSVAEHTLALILAAARRLMSMAQNFRQGSWKQELGIELSGRKLAVIGCGPIGLRVATIAASGFGMSVMGYVRKEGRLRDTTGIASFRMSDNYEEAVTGADFVTVHIPGSTDNRHFLNRDRLRRLSGTCWLVNTSRGSVLDEVALYDLLAAHQIGGAALDVFTREPYSPILPDKDLRNLDNAILTPHVASSTVQACARMAAQALWNIEAAEHGRLEDLDLLNPAVLAGSPCVNRGR